MRIKQVTQIDVAKLTMGSPGQDLAYGSGSGALTFAGLMKVVAGVGVAGHSPITSWRQTY